MDERELIELLSDKEHSSWSHWMDYLFSTCDVVDDGDGYEHYVIPRELVIRWKLQAATPYVQLSEQEKQSDRNEVAHILPIITQYIEESTREWTQEELDYLVQRWEAAVIQHDDATPALLTTVDAMAQLRKWGLLEESKA